MDIISQSTFAYFFLSLLMEGAPYILLGTLISGFIDVYMPSGMMERFLPKKRVPAILVCGLLGIILPVCECAVVPVIRRLVGKGLPVSCAFTYMLAAPIVNPVTILSTWSAFGDQQGLYVVLSRVGIGYLVAVAVGVIVMFVPVEKVLKKALLKTVSKREPEPVHSHGGGCCGHDHSHDETAHVHGEGCGHDDHEHSHEHDHSHSHEVAGGLKVVAALRSGMKDFVDVAVYFTIGVCLTAMFNILQVDYAKQIDSVAGDPLKATGLLMVLAFVLSVCSTSDAFLAATLGKFGYASKMGFMVFGPMMDVKLLFLYQTVMRKSFLWKFTIGLFLGVGAVCLLWAEWDGLREWCMGIEIGGGAR